MKDNLPLVSVIIPTYKRSDSLIRCIESVLAQTYPSIEIIIVDDNGLGTQYQIDTKNCLESFITNNKIKYIAHEVNKNGSAARNTGFYASVGEYICFLDDDDQYLPEKIYKQVIDLEKRSEDFGANYCNTRCITETNTVIDTKYSVEGDLLADYLTSKILINTSAFLFRRSTLIELNGFDEKYIRHQDFELMVRFFRNYKLACVAGEPLLVLDWSNQHPNIPNVEKLIEVERMFVEQFYDDLLRHNIYKSLLHFWYFNTCTLFIQKKDNSNAISWMRKSFRYGLFTPREIKTIIICFVRQWI